MSKRHSRRNSLDTTDLKSEQKKLSLAGAKQNIALGNIQTLSKKLAADVKILLPTSRPETILRAENDVKKAKKAQKQMQQLSQHSVDILNHEAAILHKKTVKRSSKKASKKKSSKKKTQRATGSSVYIDFVKKWRLMHQPKGGKMTWREAMTAASADYQHQKKGPQAKHL